jgi:hypothetical protein
MVRLAGQAPRFFVQDNEQEEGFSGFILELGFSRDSFAADLAIVSAKIKSKSVCLPSSFYSCSCTQMSQNYITISHPLDIICLIMEHGHMAPELYEACF